MEATHLFPRRRPPSTIVLSSIAHIHAHIVVYSGDLQPSLSATRARLSGPNTTTCPPPWPHPPRAAAAGACWRLTGKYHDLPTRARRHGDMWKKPERTPAAAKPLDTNCIPPSHISSAPPNIPCLLAPPPHASVGASAATRSLFPRAPRRQKLLRRGHPRAQPISARITRRGRPTWSCFLGRIWGLPRARSRYFRARLRADDPVS